MRKSMAALAAMSLLIGGSATADPPRGNGPILYNGGAPEVGTFGPPKPPPPPPVQPNSPPPPPPDGGDGPPCDCARSLIGLLGLMGRGGPSIPQMEAPEPTPTLGEDDSTPIEGEDIGPPRPVRPVPNAR